MKQLNTTAATGDKYLINGMECTIGAWKQGVISLHYKISATAGITQQVSTRKLNELLKTATKL